MKIPDINEKNTRAFLDKVRERASRGFAFSF